MSDTLDPIIHQPARLRIVAALAALEPNASVDFSFLKDKLGLTDGNLGAHLATLEEAGYVTAERASSGVRPKTFLALSEKGRSAFSSYRTAIERLLGGSA